MIFINSSADFSANNIGTVEIPIESDETATAIMAAYSKTLTTSQQAAFNALIVGLKNAGIYSMIEYLYLPCLAGSVSEAFYDAKNATTQDLTDTTTYGQYSVNSYGLVSVYDSENSYTPFYLSLSRTTYANTIASIANRGGSSTMSYAWYLNNCNACLRSINSTYNYVVSAMSGNYVNTATITDTLGTSVHVTQSITEENSSWTPSSDNNIVRVNSETATVTTTIESSLTISKSNKFYLGGYQNYSSASMTKEDNAVSLVAICPNLESTTCTDDSTTMMAARLHSLVGTFKTNFFS